MKTLLLSLGLVVSTLSFGQEIYSKVRIWNPNQQFNQLNELNLPLDHSDKRGDVYLDIEVSASDLQKIESADLDYTLLIEDLASYYEQQVAPSRSSRNACFTAEEIPVPEHFNGGSMGGWLTYDECLLELDSMHMLYPNLIKERTAIDTFLTHENKPIYWLKISDNPDTDETDEPEILYTAVHHAREVGSLSTIIYYMWYLLENYDSDDKVKALIDNTEMYFVPVINPDGYVYNETTNPNGGGMWRKNRRDNLDGTFGVDLNRNYGYQWGFDNQGSSPDPASETYRGIYGFSEPETQAMKFLCEAHEFETAFNYHSYGNLLIYPWGFSASFLTPDSTTYRNISDLFTSYNGYLAGTGDETVGYIVNGDSDDWMYGEQNSKNKILAMTPEVGDASDGFWPHPSQATEIAFENLSANLNLSAVTLPYLAASVEPLELVTGDSLFVYVNHALLSDSSGSFSIELNSSNPNVASISNPIQVTNPVKNQVATDSFLVVFSSFSGVEEIDLTLTVDQNLYTDTIDLKALRITLAPSFVDDISDMSSFSSTSSWDTDTTVYASGPLSIGDSPGRMYFNNQLNKMSFNQELHLENATYAYVSFDAIWAIEDNYDYVTLQAKGSNSLWTSLCGRYTDEGSSFQLNGEPVWDGTKSEWVTEVINLEDFIGESVELRWIFYSDAFVRDQGFNMDNFKIYTDGYTSSTEETYVDHDISIYPNPTQNEFSIQSGVVLKSIELLDFNGRVIRRNTIDSRNYTWSLVDLPSGVYFLRITPTSGTAKTERIIKL